MTVARPPSGTHCRNQSVRRTYPPPAAGVRCLNERSPLHTKIARHARTHAPASHRGVTRKFRKRGSAALHHSTHRSWAHARADDPSPRAHVAWRLPTRLVARYCALASPVRARPLRPGLVSRRASSRSRSVSTFRGAVWGGDRLSVVPFRRDGDGDLVIERGARRLGASSG